MPSDTQKKMLGGGFYIDGWNNRRFVDDADDLVARGLLRMEEGGDDQYTIWRYHETEAGKALAQTLGIT